MVLRVREVAGRVCCRYTVVLSYQKHSCCMQHAGMDLPLHRRADSTFRISLKMQNADAECRMQNPAQNDYSVCAACRVQDAGRRIGPKMDSSACREGLYGADALYADCNLHATTYAG